MIYHKVDTITVMKSIELLDKYFWNITTNKDTATDKEKENVALTLRSLRNTIKDKNAYINGNTHTAV